MRLLAIREWHHFAYMIISLALLGFGASGTLLTLIRTWALPRFTGLYAANAVLFGLSAVVCFAIAQGIPFNGLELIWNPHQLGWLTGVYTVLAIPFFFAATCFGLAFMRYSEAIHRVYRWDLVGAGSGAVLILGLLTYLEPMTCLKVIGCLGIAGAVLVLLDARHRHWAALLTLGGILALALIGVPWPKLEPSPYKGLEQTLQVMGAEVIAERSSPLGLLSVVTSPVIPLRHAPGLSLTSIQEPPLQLGVFTDADGLSVITHFDGDWTQLAYLGELTSAAPYTLFETPSVLILGAGGGTDVLQALYHRATHVDAVELNPQMVALMQETFADFAGDVYRHPRVAVHIADARGFLAQTDRSYDLIQIALLDSFAAAGAGTHALGEGFLYTVEALAQAYRALQPGGVLAITRWLKLPPRDSLKLFATAIEVLEQAGSLEPGAQLALIRGWQTSTLLIKSGAFTPMQIARLRAFAQARAFDMAWYPGMPAAEANRYNVLERPYLYEGAQALLSESRASFLDRYKFNIAPATDDRPYFFHFFKWRLLPELYELREQGALILLDAGYLILVATLAQALPVSAILILLPLIQLRKTALPERTRLAGYFLALGFAFLFIEIAFLQRLTVFVTHPVYAAATVLSGFLIFAGLGSGFSRYLDQVLARHALRAVTVAISVIVGLSLLYLVLLPMLFNAWIDWPLPAKVVVSLALIAPLAFFMGMPFPLGLARLAERAPAFIPWAWAINGCASVLSAILAALLAMHIGFGGVIMLAVGLYIIAALVWRR